MSKLDDELKIALRREQPPAGFADRVIQRIQEPPLAAGPVAKTNWWDRLIDQLAPFRLSGRWVTAGAMAAALLLVTVAVFYRHRQEELSRQEAERAKAQVVLALQIASSKLNIAQKKVFENGDHVIGDRSTAGLQKEIQ